MLKNAEKSPFLAILAKNHVFGGISPK